MKTVKIVLKKKVLFHAKVYTNIFLLFKGLRFSKPLQPRQALLLASSKENLQAIDMLFVSFPIDAVWINKNHQIIHIVRNIKPFTTLIVAPQKVQYILECPANATMQLKKGQKLVFKS